MVALALVCASWFLVVSVAFLCLQEWSHASARGCLFLEEDGGVSSLQYRLHLPQTTCVYLTIQPLNLSQRPGKWLALSHMISLSLTQ